MTPEAIAILISGAGIIATCGVETWLVTRQIKASESINRDQIKVQNAALQSQFAFQKDEAKRARILSNRRESMDIIRELSAQVRDTSELKDSCDLYVLIERTSLAIIVTDLCRDLPDGPIVWSNFHTILDALSDLPDVDNDKVIRDLLTIIMKGTEDGLKELDKSR